MAFKLESADILVNINDRRDPISSVKRWASGPYEHVFIYLGDVALLVGLEIIRIPMLFESDGDGVVIESLSSRYGQKVVVMRLKSEFDRRRVPAVTREAIRLAEDPQAKYDYACIRKYVIPRLVIRKFGLPLAVKYHRDPLMICSEAGFEIFYRGGLVDILGPGCTPPMPGDFVTDSPLLEEVNCGVLSGDWVWVVKTLTNTPGWHRQ